MRDTRKLRTALVIAATAAVGAIVGELYVRPALERAVGKR